jgi:hypothetical protein
MFWKLRFQNLEQIVGFCHPTVFRHQDPSELKFTVPDCHLRLKMVPFKNIENLGQVHF